MTTIRAQVEAAAQKAAREIRDTMERYAQETGMTAEVSVVWISSHRISHSSADHAVGEVRITTGSMEVSG